MVLVLVRCGLPVARQWCRLNVAVALCLCHCKLTQPKVHWKEKPMPHAVLTGFLVRGEGPGWAGAVTTKSWFKIKTANGCERHYLHAVLSFLQHHPAPVPAPAKQACALRPRPPWEMASHCFGESKQWKALQTLPLMLALLLVLTLSDAHGLGVPVHAE